MCDPRGHYLYVDSLGSDLCLFSLSTRFSINIRHIFLDESSLVTDETTIWHLEGCLIVLSRRALANVIIEITRLYLSQRRRLAARLISVCAFVARFCCDKRISVSKPPQPAVCVSHCARTPCGGVELRGAHSLHNATHLCPASPARELVNSEPREPNTHHARATALHFLELLKNSCESCHQESLTL